MTTPPNRKALKEANAHTVAVAPTASTGPKATIIHDIRVSCGNGDGDLPARITWNR